MDKLLAIINRIRRGKSEPELAALAPETRLREDVGFDSLDLAELTVRLEAEFGVDVFDSGNVSTVGEVLAKLEK